MQIPDISPEEKERIEKIFLEEMESLRKEEAGILEEFSIKLEDKLFIDHTSNDFDFTENVKLFLNELAENENKLYEKKDEFEQTSVFQALSRLRILKEKAQTGLAKAQYNSKGL